MALENGEHCCGFCKALLRPVTSIFVLFFLALTSSSHSHHETIQEYLEFDLLISLFLAVCVCVFKPPLSSKGYRFWKLSLGLFTMRRGAERDIIYNHFHVLNLVSGSHSYVPCWARFTVSPEAWGRGPSRRRLILLALSLLRKINALRNIWHTPSILLAEQQERYAWGTMCTEVIGVGGRGHFIFVMCSRYHILNVI